MENRNTKWYICILRPFSMIEKTIKARETGRNVKKNAIFTSQS
jgi:hypothetical protein